MWRGAKEAHYRHQRFVEIGGGLFWHRRQKRGLRVGVTTWLEKGRGRKDGERLQPRRNNNNNNQRRQVVTATTSTERDQPPVKAPTREQLRKHFVAEAVPMIAFGITDQTIMIHAGNAIDLTLGVTFGLSTLSAAACGQICSDMAGVTFGGAIESVASKCGLPEARLSGRQQALTVSKRVGFFGRLVGIFLGCLIGLSNLYFIDVGRTQQLKLEAASTAEHEVDVSNRDRRDATTVTVAGPDTDGLVASIATTLAAAGFSLLEIRGGPKLDGENSEDVLDVFVVQKDGDRVDDSDLDFLGRIVVDACRRPKRAMILQADNQRLLTQNAALEQKIQRLQDDLDRAAYQVKINRADTTSVYLGLSRTHTPNPPPSGRRGGHPPPPPGGGAENQAPSGSSTAASSSSSSSDSDSDRTTPDDNS